MKKFLTGLALATLSISASAVTIANDKFSVSYTQLEPVLNFVCEA